MFLEPPDTDVKEGGQTAGPSLIRKHLSPQLLACPTPLLPGFLPCVFSYSPHHTIRQLLLLAPFYRGGNWFK